MFNHSHVIHRFSLLVTLIGSVLFSSLASAIVIEAKGQAVIIDGDLIDARQRAVQDASQQAALQASVYVSTSSHVKNGILSVDNLHVSSLGTLNNTKVIDERIHGSVLHVMIRTNVITEQGCKNGITNNYQKTLAVAAFPLLDPRHSNLGGLGNVAWELPNAIANRLTKNRQVHAFKATKLNIYPSINTAASRQLDDGTLTSVAENAHQLGSQFVLSGVIRDMTMIDTSIHNEGNYFKDLYNRLDYKSSKYLRQLELDVFLHDGFTGALLSEQRYTTAGLWNLDKSVTTGFNSASFRELDFGKKALELIDTIAKDIETDLGCRQFVAPILHAQGYHIWFDAGQASGIEVGDRFSVMHRAQMYQGYGEFSQQISNTERTLIIDEVQPNAIRGSLSNVVNQQNILPGDIVVAH